MGMNPDVTAGSGRIPLVVGAGLLLVAALLTSACAEATPGSVQGDWAAEREERGDTLVVRTVSGSVWGDTMVLVPEVTIGEMDGADPYLFGNVRGLDVDDRGRILVVDAQAREVRVFSPEGRHLHSFGRRGEGPGEFSEPDVIRIRDDGLLVIRDQRNARFSLFAPEGEHRGGWSLRGGFFTGTPFYLTDDGEVFHPTLRNLGADVGPGQWQHALVRYDREGTVADTLDVPTRGREPPSVEVRTENVVNRSLVPFSPREFWALTPWGDFLFGHSGMYRIERWNQDGSVLATERVSPAAPVRAGEARYQQELITRRFRQVDASWRWQGDGVPDVKPFYQNLLSGRDGTIWVLRHSPGFEEENPDYDPDRPDQGFPTRWTEPQVFDVFDENGRYLGPVKAPRELRVWTTPVLTAEGVWAVAPHELGYDQVIRFRLEPYAP